MANDRRDGGERPRDRYRDRDGHRDLGRDRDRGNTPDDRRNRSRSPRRERGGRRDRYRSRSPIRRDDRDRRERGDRANDRRHDRDDRDRSSRDFGSTRDPPKGPRGVPSGPRRDFKSGGPVKQPPGSRADSKEDEDVDIKMEGQETRRERPAGMDDDTWEMYQIMGFGRFKSTKNTKVPGNDMNFGVRKDKQMTARQYMNRQGGFNRPLSPSRQ